jgi:hypothetical protein
MLDRILAILYEPITERLEALMATVEQLQTQLADAKTSLQDAIGRVEDDVQHLKDNAGIDPADLDPISQGLADLKAATDALDPDPDNPPPA